MNKKRAQVKRSIMAAIKGLPTADSMRLEDLLLQYNDALCDEYAEREFFIYRAGLFRGLSLIKFLAASPVEEKLADVLESQAPLKQAAAL